jgi:hypothetical protein
VARRKNYAGDKSCHDDETFCDAMSRSPLPLSDVKESRQARTKTNL